MTFKCRQSLGNWRVYSFWMKIGQRFQFFQKNPRKLQFIGFLANCERTLILQHFEGLFPCINRSGKQLRHLSKWLHITQYQTFFLLLETKCDAIKQNELELTNINLKIQPNKADNFFVFHCFCNHSKCYFSRTNRPISIKVSPN